MALSRTDVCGWARFWLVMATLAAEIRPAWAEPHLALRTGHQCQACHVNQTGGGKRNAFGVYYEQEMLPDLALPAEGPMKQFDGQLHDRFLVGADLRMVNLTRVSSEETDNSFETREGNVYFDLILGPGPLRLYSDVRLAPGGAQARELFAMAGQLPGHLYVKAGRFFPPYGWRLHDDQSFVRRETGFNFLGADQGVELGWQPGPLSASLAITNGNGGVEDDNTNKQVSLVGNWVTPRFQLGGSGATNRQGDSSLLLAGMMAGLKLHERFGVLGEFDFGRREADADGTTERLVLAYAEANLWLTDGLTLRAAFDYSDPDRSRSGDESNRVSAGAEWFAVPAVKLRLDWSRTDRPPEVDGVIFRDDRRLLVEVHVFL